MKINKNIVTHTLAVALAFAAGIGTPELVRVIAEDDGIEQPTVTTDTETLKPQVWRLWYVVQHNATPDTRIEFVTLETEGKPDIDSLPGKVILPDNYSYQQFYRAELLKGK